MEYKVGMFVEWETWGGNKYEGIIKELEGDTAHVLCTDGVTRATSTQYGGVPNGNV